VKSVEVQYGGFGVMRGESSGITSYGGSIYLVGQRVILRKPKKLFFDEVAVTYAYLGDYNKPNVFKRLHRLNESNYHQFLVSKQMGKRAVVSADYTFQSGAETMREAIRVNVKELRVIDWVRFETYQRMDVNRDSGFAVYGEKAITKRFTMSGGFASIDRKYGGLNADNFDIGKRVYMTTGFALTPELTLNTFLSHAVSNDFAVSNKTRFDLAVTFDILKALRRIKNF
jgi:hypothetical protein